MGAFLKNVRPQSVAGFVPFFFFSPFPFVGSNLTLLLYKHPPPPKKKERQIEVETSPWYLLLVLLKYQKLAAADRAAEWTRGRRSPCTLHTN